MEMAAVGSSPDVNIVVQLTRPANLWRLLRRVGRHPTVPDHEERRQRLDGRLPVLPEPVATFLNAVGPRKGSAPGQITQLLSNARRTRKGFALHSTVPTIDPGTPAHAAPAG